MHELKKYTIVFAIFAFIILSASLASAPLSCYYNSTLCNPAKNEVKILGMSSQYNAHAELVTMASYTGGICCSGITGLDASCSESVNHAHFLKLSSQTNAHVGQVSKTNYPETACISATNAVACDYRSDCSGDVCVVTMSADTNAHVADCNGLDNYSIKVCCNIASPPEVTEAYWTDMLGNRITGANRTDTVILVATGSNLGNSFNFSVYKRGDSSPLAEIPNQEITTWKTPDVAGAKYYFKIKTEFYGEMGQSADLNVKEAENSPPVSIITLPNYQEKINYYFMTGTWVYFRHASYDIDDDIRNASFEWNFGNNVKSGVLNFTSANTTKYLYSDLQGGGKNIILKVTDLRGGEGSSSTKIYVDNPLRDDPPVAIISTPKDGSTLNSSTILFNASLSTDDNTLFDKLVFTWRFNDNDPSHVKVNGTLGAVFIKQFRFASTPENPHWAELTVQD